MSDPVVYHKDGTERMKERTAWTLRSYWSQRRGEMTIRSHVYSSDVTEATN